MTGSAEGGVLRSIAVIVAAIFMALANGILGLRIVEVGTESLPTVIDPAGYAFFVWGVIFLLGLISAFYQGRPSNRDRLLMRSVGWLMAAQFALTGLWPGFVVAGKPNLAHATLFLMGIVMAVIYLRVATSTDVRQSDGWGVAIPVAVPLGWLTAANAVSLASRLLDSGVLSPGVGANVVAAALLIAAGCVAGWLIRRGQAGPTALWAGYAATIVWGVVAIVVQQWSVSAVGVAAALAAVFVAAAIGLSGYGEHGAAGQRS